MAKTARIYGHISAHLTGSTFPDRESLSKAGIHRATQAGITGGADGTESIVLNAGYIDDLDFGSEVLYTGAGGRNGNTKRQVADQELTKGNLGLAVAHDRGLPIRVCRGPKLGPPFGTQKGYRYDGLYRVADYWHEQGRDGFRIYRFKLISIPDQSTVFDENGTPQASHQLPTVIDRPAQSRTNRVETTTLRIVRDTELSKRVKEAHHYRCQVCDTQLIVPTGFYAEAAHVRPLGTGHDGPDIEGNVLCLCPNHHVLFDRGTIWIDDNLTIQPMKTPLLRQDICKVNMEHIRYHRNIRST